MVGLLSFVELFYIKIVQFFMGFIVEILAYIFVEILFERILGGIIKGIFKIIY